MDKTPWESAQKLLVLALWGSRFVDLNVQRRNDEPARHCFGSFFARSWGLFSKKAAKTSRALLRHF
jgi:hypothetical protein